VTSTDQRWPALTVWNPWAAAIAAGDPRLRQQHVKRIETRFGRPPDAVVGGPLLIHAGKTYDDEGAYTLRDLGVRFGGAGATREWMRRLLAARGAVVAVVTLESCRRLARTPNDVRGCYSATLDDETVLFVLGTLTSEYDRKIGWFLGRVSALERPVPCRGQQGIWWPSAETLAAVRAQLPGDETRQAALL
jgi:hypothetical protein